MNYDVSTFDVKEYDRILACGLSHGLGKRGEKVCIEAAICQVLGLPHGDDPGCVSEAVRAFKIALNDSTWSSPLARAEGMRDLGLAQLGSKGIVSDLEFSRRMTEKTIRILIPALFRDVFKDNADCLEAADLCEKQGTIEAAEKARVAANAAANAANAVNAAANAVYAVNAAAYAAFAANAAANAAFAANAAANAAYAKSDKYLNLAAKLALEVLRELDSPGVSLL